MKYLMHPVCILPALAAILLAEPAQAATYYVSNTGNDSAAGTSSAAPWKTVAKVNSKMATFVPGDQILFKRGGTWRETMNITKSGATGNPITFGAFGTGAQPILSAGEPVSGWTSTGTNRWVANVTVPPPNTAYLARPMTIVSQSGALRPLGRTPNTGYLNYESTNNSSTITDNQLPVGSWTGAEAVIRLRPWLHERQTITGQTGQTLTANPYSYWVLENTGYFLQNSLATLDSAGEWFYDAASTPKKLYLQQATSPTGVEACARENVVNVGDSVSWIQLTQLDLRMAQSCLIKGDKNSDVTVDNCSLRLAGGHAILFQGAQPGGIDTPIYPCSNITVRYSAVSDCVNNGIILGPFCNNSQVYSNTVQKVALNPGMNQPKDGQTFPIQVVGNTSLVTHNTVSQVAGHGILFSGSGHQVNENVVKNFALNVDDVGGIYTAFQTGATGNQIISNIVLDGVGAPAGKEDASVNAAQGIYLDEQGDGVQVYFNTAARCGGSGIFIHDCHGGDIQYNSCFDNRTSQIHWASDLVVISAFTLANNDLVSLRESAACMTFSSKFNGYDMPYYANMDYNVYAHPFRQYGTVTRNFKSDTNIPQVDTMTLAEWKAFSGQDTNSNTGSVSAPISQAYTISGTNLVTNGTFDTSLSGWNMLYNLGGLTWDNTNTWMTGGSLSQTVPTTADDATTLVGLGSVAPTDRLWVRFRNQATRNFGPLEVSIQDTTNPNSPPVALTWSPTPVEAEWGAHENSIIIKPKAANATASLTFRMHKWAPELDSQNKFWLDNVSVHRVTDNLSRVGYTDNTATAGRIGWLFYNTNATNQTVSWTGTRKFPNGSQATSPLTLVPYESVVLLEN